SCALAPSREPDTDVRHRPYRRRSARGHSPARIVPPVLTPFDDYPIHQTSEPVAHTAQSSLNHYDRYFFNGYTRDRSLYFGAALGVYPNRKVMDAAFAVLHDGEEISVIASRRAPLDPTETRVGPISITIEEPFRRMRVRVEPNDSGIEADLVFGARSAVVEE